MIMPIKEWFESITPADVVYLSLIFALSLIAIYFIIRSNKKSQWIEDLTTDNEKIMRNLVEEKSILEQLKQKQYILDKLLMEYRNYTVPVFADGPRQSGRSTRLIDKYVQDLFSIPAEPITIHGEDDMSENLVSEEEKREQAKAIAEKIMTRMKREHNLSLTISNKGRRPELRIKGEDAYKLSAKRKQIEDAWKKKKEQENVQGHLTSNQSQIS